jgi:hypothetical protein
MSLTMARVGSAWLRTVKLANMPARIKPLVAP